MKRFRVEVVLSDGINQEHWFIDAESEEHAARIAVSKGGTPIAIRLANGSVWDWIHIPIGNNHRVNDGALALFSEQLSELLQAGLTLEQGLGLIDKAGWSNFAGQICRAFASKNPYGRESFVRIVSGGQDISCCCWHCCRC